MISFCHKTVFAMEQWSLKYVPSFFQISTYAGDITKLEVDAIVNACNNSIMGDAACVMGDPTIKITLTITITTKITITATQ